MSAHDRKIGSLGGSTGRPGNADYRIGKMIYDRGQQMKAEYAQRNAAMQNIGSNNRQAAPTAYPTPVNSARNTGAARSGNYPYRARRGILTEIGDGISSFIKAIFKIILGIIVILLILNALSHS